MFKNIVQSLFAKGLVAIINFLILIVSSHYLGVSSRGEIGILILNISIIQIVNDIFTGYTLVYFVPKFDLKKIFLVGVVYTLLSCTLSNSVFYVIKKHVPGFEYLSFVISFIVILNTFNCVLILGKEKIAMYNFLNLVQPLLLLIGIVVATYFLKIGTFEAYIWPLFFSFVLASLVSLFVVINLLGKEPTGKPFRLKPIMVNGFLCQIAVLMSLLCNRYSYYLLENDADVGLYSSASSLIESVLIISNGIAPVLLSKVANDGDNDRSRKMTVSLAKACFIASVFCVLIIAVIPESFFIFLLSEGFVNIKKVMLMYSPGILMLSFAGILSHYFSATGKLKTILLCNSLGFVCAMILSHALIGKYRLTGAAISADISFSVLSVSLGIAYFIQNKLTLKDVFSVKEDYKNLKELLFRSAG
ncbi:MAG: polysaccharide biosynthesis protein [Bacteroidetes bacterium]|jgi:O-antigen/teichoic acid export membrane protein|nr:polysaccharide biosynthesis protein [Bacteroidota bacterium]